MNELRIKYNPANNIYAVLSRDYYIVEIFETENQARAYLTELEKTNPIKYGDQRLACLALLKFHATAKIRRTPNNETQEFEKVFAQQQAKEKLAVEILKYADVTVTEDLYENCYQAVARISLPMVADKRIIDLESSVEFWRKKAEIESRRAIKWESAFWQLRNAPWYERLFRRSFKVE